MGIKLLDDVVNRSLVRYVGVEAVYPVESREVLPQAEMSLDADIPLWHQHPGTYRSRPGRVFAVPDADVFMPDNLLTATGRRYNIVRESAIADAPLRSVQRFAIAKKRSMSGTYGIYRSRNKGYYHLLIENLQRLFVLSKFTQEVNLLLDAAPSELEELFIRSLFRSHTISVVEGPAIVRVERLLLPTYLNHEHRGFIHPEFKAFVDRTFPESPGSAERVFISRDRYYRRHIVNQDEVMTLLGKMGFTMYHLEDLSITDQISLFRKASIVVAAHGAGLSNLLFSRAGTKVVEISPMNVVIPHYFHIAKSVGAEYHFLLSAGNDRHAQIEVNLEKLAMELTGPASAG